MDKITNVAISEIGSNPLQSARVDFKALHGDGESGGMIASVEVNGVLQPIRLRLTTEEAVDYDGNPVPEKYQTIFGTHRTLCVRHLYNLAVENEDKDAMKRWSTIPAIIEGKADDGSAALAMIAENMARREPKEARLQAIVDLVHLHGMGTVKLPALTARQLGQDAGTFAAALSHGMYSIEELLDRKPSKEVDGVTKLGALKLGAVAREYVARFGAEDSTESPQLYSIKGLASMFPGDSESTVRRSFMALRAAYKMQAALTTAAKADGSTEVEKAKAEAFDVIDFALTRNKSLIRSENQKSEDRRAAEARAEVLETLTPEETVTFEEHEAAVKAVTDDETVAKQQATAARRLDKRAKAKIEAEDTAEVEFTVEDAEHLLAVQSRIEVIAGSLASIPQVGLEAVWSVCSQLAFLTGDDTSLARTVDDALEIAKAEKAKKDRDAAAATARKAAAKRAKDEANEVVTREKLIAQQAEIAAKLAAMGEEDALDGEEEGAEE